MVINDYAAAGKMKKCQHLFSILVVSTVADRGRPEREMFLGKVAESNHNHGSKDFGHRGKEMKLLNEQFDENIIQRDTNEHQHKIPQ